MIRRFFEAEVARAGWRFWVLWVLATNVAFFPGLAFGQACGGNFAEPFASGVVALSFALPVGFLQWLVLRRHLPRWQSWVAATSLGWAIGAVVSAALLLSFTSVTPGGVSWIVAVGFVSGGAVGVAQLPLFRRALPSLAPWWVFISAVAWGVFFPGAITGFFLARALGMRAA